LNLGSGLLLQMQRLKKGGAVSKSIDVDLIYSLIVGDLVLEVYESSNGINWTLVDFKGLKYRCGEGGFKTVAHALRDGLNSCRLG